MHPVLIGLPGFTLYSYWFFIVLGGLAAALFWRSHRAELGLRTDQQFWLLLDAIIIGAFVGGRVVHMLVYVPFSRPDYWDIALSWNRGFSILGDVLGGSAGAYLFCRSQGIGFPRVYDYLTLMCPVWDFFGRFGCLSAGCCYGRPPRGTLPWAIAFRDPRSEVPEAWLGTPLHPTQLYEAGAEALVFWLLYKLVLPRVRSGEWPRGSVAACYFACYGVLRFADEFFRGDVVPTPLGLTAAQWIALTMLAAGLAALAVLRRPRARAR